MTSSIIFILNDELVSSEINPSYTLLDFIRKQERLTGTKEGCREGDCGACTVLIGELKGNHVKYQSVNSCLFPSGDVNGKHVVTIEGLKTHDLSVIQNAFVEEGASQCGFCTPGFVVSLTGYYLANKLVDSKNAIGSMDGNICRCTGHISIIRAALKANKNLSTIKTSHFDHLTALIKEGILPEYFKKIRERLKKIKQEEIQLAETMQPQYFIAGGTDLFVQKWEDILKQETKLLSTNGISSIIKKEDGKCVIGARATVTDFIESEVITKYFPSLREQLKLFGSVPIRNKATVGGNIVNASPIADITNILLALNSTLHLKKKNEERDLFIKDFFKSYKTLDLDEGELIDKISFDLPKENSYFNFEKVSKRTYLDIASTNSSIFLEIENDSINSIHLSAGGVAPIPLYLKNTSEFLTGKTISADIIKAATEIFQTEISPISDARGSAEYKTLLLKQLIYAHFITLFPEKVRIKEIA
jgi:xanthine dehydrogenase small subunit